MEYITIAVVAIFASGLTFFSGFGLGTILLPVFALFFPVEEAVALTAIVHLLNNLFKLSLIGKNTNIRIVFLFGIPAMIAAFFGAYLLTFFHSTHAIASYELLSRTFSIEINKIVIAVLIIFFSLFDLMPNWSKKINMTEKKLPFGGLISGFFGGLSGHQGALRSAFLIKLNLKKEAFIATGVLIAVLIDLTRISVYGREVTSFARAETIPLLLTAILSAFLGALIGKRLLKKITVIGIQKMIAFLMATIAVLMGFGII